MSSALFGTNDDVAACLHAFCPVGLARFRGHVVQRLFAEQRFEFCFAAGVNDAAVVLVVAAGVDDDVAIQRADQPRGIGGAVGGLCVIPLAAFEAERQRVFRL